MAGKTLSSYMQKRDPRRGCGSASPFMQSLGYSSAKGYQYTYPKTSGLERKAEKFNFWKFLGNAAMGAVTGGVTSAAFYGAGKGIEKLVAGFRAGRGGSKTVYDVYAGVKQASEYLKQQEVPRAYRKQILESFDVRTIKLETAGESTYGLRFYGGNARVEGRYLFETFSPQTNRANLALPYEWNSMTGIQQFQVKSGTTMITGAAAPQTGYGPQYIGGAHQWYINSLEDMIKCQ